MIEQLLAELAERVEAKGPADDGQVERAVAALGRFSSDDYVEFLRSMDGVEGDAGDFGYLVLWSASELEELNEAYCTDEFLTDVFLIGSDGGGEAIGLAARDGGVGVARVPFIPMVDDEVRVIAASFTEFLALVVGR
jgi:hypothetical protein